MNSPTGKTSGNVTGSPLRLPFTSYINRPPCYETVVSWFTGKTSSATTLKDSSTPQHDLVMSQAPCLLMDGVATITWSAPITIVSTEGASVIASDGSGIPTSGTLYKIVLDTGAVISCSELSGDKIYSSDYENDGIYGTIVSADIPAVRAGRQDTYFAQNTIGWWEIAGDPVYYPYPVANFDTYHAPETFNDATTTYSFKEDGVGNFDGLVDRVVLNAGTGVTYDLSALVVFGILPSLKGSRDYIFTSGVVDGHLISLFGNSTGDTFVSTSKTSTGQTNWFDTNHAIIAGKEYSVRLVSDGVTQTVTIDGSVYTQALLGTPAASPLIIISADQVAFTHNGTIRDAVVDGISIPLNDGELYGNTTKDIHDYQGNVVGTLITLDAPAFWSVTKSPYKVQQMDTENYFVDGLGNSIGRTQVEFEDGTVINNNDKYFFGSISPKPKELILHGTALTEPCLGETKTRIGL